MPKGMTSPWEFYACDKGHNLYIEITNNNAANCEGMLAYRLHAVVYSHVKHSKAIAARCERNSKLLPITPINLAALKSITMGLVESITHDYGIEFVFGDEAWVERLKLPQITIEDMWKNYLDSLKLDLKTLTTDERITVTQAWIDKWTYTFHKHQEQLIIFGKEKLKRLTDKELL